jgi:hypothetical protein
MMSITETCFLVLRDRLSPDFRQRVAGLRAEGGGCAGCAGPVEMADQIAMVMLADGGAKAGMICRECAELPRAELVEKLAIIEGAEDDQALFVSHAKMAECAIAISCALDPQTAVNWRVGDEWNYGLEKRWDRQLRPLQVRRVGEY